MNPPDYVAVKALYDAAGKVLAFPGETCERVPAGSLPWLEAKGAIKKAERRPAKAAPKATQPQSAAQGEE